MTNQTKSELRNHYRYIRQQISVSERDAAANAAADIFTQQAIFKNSQHIACYYAIKSEFDCTPIIKAIWQTNKNCYLPALTPEKKLIFKCYQPQDPLQKNCYGIPEPIQGDAVLLEKLDIVIVPLLAFDLNYHRLGTGGGYYDRTLAPINNKPPFLLGLGFDAQQGTALPADQWDIVLNGILTESNFFME